MGVCDGGCVVELYCVVWCDLEFWWFYWWCVGIDFDWYYCVEVVVCVCVVYCGCDCVYWCDGVFVVCV